MGVIPRQEAPTRFQVWRVYQFRHARIERTSSRGLGHRNLRGSCRPYGVGRHRAEAFLCADLVGLLFPDIGTVDAIHLPVLEHSLQSCTYDARPDVRCRESIAALTHNFRYLLRTDA